MNNFSDKVDELRNASPLELPSKIQEIELHDRKEAQAVIDEINAEFEKQGNLVDEVVVPVFMSIADGLLESTAMTRKLRKKGLTASRVVNECMAFSYDQTESIVLTPDGYTEWKNVGEQTRADFHQFGEEKRPDYNREVYEDGNRLDAYKDRKFEENGGTINATDEYTGKKNVYKDQAHTDARRNVIKYKHDHRAEVDHIVPLKRIHEQFKGNYALTNEDIKYIANQDSNYALTSARINRAAGASGCGGKSDKTISEFVEDQRQREKEGRPNLGLSEEAKDNMLRMGRDAQKQINKDANKAIGANLVGRGTGDTKEIWGKAVTNARNQSKDYVMGNVILFIIKPIYYEIADIFRNGLKEGVNADSNLQAFKIRFGRVKDYVMSNAKQLLKDNLWEFIKGFISSLIEGIISLFVGIFKQILKVIKEGIKIFVQAGKVLFGKDASKMTTAEKGDAIIKILGGSVIAICGIGIEALLNKIGIGEPWSVVLSTMLSGIASTLFMLLLDRIDLFDVKEEKRRQRINEIFDLRIKDIQEKTQVFDAAAQEAIRSSYEKSQSFLATIEQSFANEDYESLNTALVKYRQFLLPETPLPSIKHNWDC